EDSLPDQHRPGSHGSLSVCRQGSCTSRGIRRHQAKDVRTVYTAFVNAAWGVHLIQGVLKVILGSNVSISEFAAPPSKKAALSRQSAEDLSSGAFSTNSTTPQLEASSQVESYVR